MRILHIHQDYPDGRPYPYTKAVSNLVDACQKLNAKDEHIVLSINRTSNPFKVSCKKFEQGISLIYWAIPLPFIYYFSMRLSAYLIYRHIKKLNLSLDMIHAHKLTCEGVFAFWLSKRFNTPYAISIRGGSDSHNLARLSLHRPFFEKIYKKATNVFWVSPWAKNSFSSILNLHDKHMENSSNLPNICNINLKNNTSKGVNKTGYITAISFHQYKRKGILTLIRAIASLKSKGNMITLDIYGSGEQRYIDIIQNEIDELDLQDLICIKGEIAQENLLLKMNESKGFLMPSTNETFGMTYIEALSVCCPILYLSNTGVDGYLDDVSAGIKIDNQSISEVETGIINLEANADIYEKLLEKLSEQLYLKKFTKEYVARSYLTTLNCKS